MIQRLNTLQNDLPDKSSKHVFLYKVLALLLTIFLILGFPGGSDDKEPACSAEDLGSIPGSEDPMEKGMATHSSILAWRIPMDRRTWRATVHGVVESDTTQRLSTHMFLILYNISLWLIHFTTGSSYFLIPFSYFTQPLMQLLSDNQQFLCVWIYFRVHLSFQIRIIIFFA